MADVLLSALIRDFLLQSTFLEVGQARPLQIIQKLLLFLVGQHDVAAGFTDHLLKIKTDKRLRDEKVFSFKNVTPTSKKKKSSPPTSCLGHGN